MGRKRTEDDKVPYLDLTSVLKTELDNQVFCDIARLASEDKQWCIHYHQRKDKNREEQTLHFTESQGPHEGLMSVM